MSSRTEDTAAFKLSQIALRRAKAAHVIGVGALIAGLLLFLYFLYESGFFSLLIPQTQPLQKPAEVSAQVTGTEAVIHGFDKDGLAFTITSKQAKQDAAQKDMVLLTLPTGEFDRTTGNKLNLSAAVAVYNTSTKKLLLEGDVVFAQAGRYKAQMDKAQMDLNTMGLSSLSAVHVDLSTGGVDADHLEISDGGKKTLFTGHVKAKLETDIKSEIVP
jgi:hypothetical protein